jgi:hypothetical protein
VKGVHLRWGRHDKGDNSRKESILRGTAGKGTPKVGGMSITIDVAMTLVTERVMTCPGGRTCQHTNSRGGEGHDMAVGRGQIIIGETFEGCIWRR